MKKPMEYLTDSELDCLIREIEKRELLQASPDLQEQIWEKVKLDKVAEYKRFRFRVLTTVAAAVLAVFLAPEIENLQQQDCDFVKPLKDREIVVEHRFEPWEKELTESRKLENMLGGVNIFADNNKWNLFRE